MIRIAVCDMDEKDRNRIVRYCKNYLKDKIINYEIKEYTSGETLLAAVFPDILFLDTEFRLLDGILIKEILYKMRAETKIIFVSRERKHISKAFGKNVYAFIEKPMSYPIFREKMEDIWNDIMDEKNSVFCKNKKDIEKILFRDILYIQAYGRYTKIFVKGKAEYRLCDKSFGEWYLEMENKEFLCCHRSYLVNIFYIDYIRNEIRLINGCKIPIGEKKREEFFEAYKAYIRSSKTCKDS